MTATAWQSRAEQAEKVPQSPKSHVLSVSTHSSKFTAFSGLLLLVRRNKESQNENSRVAQVATVFPLFLVREYVRLVWMLATKKAPTTRRPNGGRKQEKEKH